MREGLRLVEEHEERRKVKLEALRAEIQKGFDSGPAEEFNPRELTEKVKAEGRKRLAAISCGIGCCSRGHFSPADPITRTS